MQLDIVISGKSVREMLRLLPLGLLVSIIGSVCCASAASMEQYERAVLQALCSEQRWDSFGKQPFSGQDLPSYIVKRGKIAYILIEGNLEQDDEPKDLDRLTFIELADTKLSPFVFLTGSFPPSLKDVNVGKDVARLLNQAPPVMLKLTRDCNDNVLTKELADLKKLMIPIAISSVRRELAHDAAMDASEKFDERKDILLGDFDPADQYTYAFVPEVNKVFRIFFRNESDPSGNGHLARRSFPTFEVSPDSRLVELIKLRQAK